MQPEEAEHVEVRASQTEPKLSGLHALSRPVRPAYRLLHPSHVARRQPLSRRSYGDDVIWRPPGHVPRPHLVFTTAVTGGFMSRLSAGRPRNSKRVAWMSLMLSSSRPGFTMSAMASQSQQRVSIQSTVRGGSRIRMHRRMSLPLSRTTQGLGSRPRNAASPMPLHDSLSQTRTSWMSSRLSLI